MSTLTRARAWQAATMRPDSLLQLIRQASPDFVNYAGPDLRRFACWCARDAAAAAAGALAHRILHAAEKYALGLLSPEMLAAERRSVQGLAAGAGTVGLRKGFPTAAIQLAAIRTADEDPFEAAKWASHYAVLAGILRDGESAGVVIRLRLSAALRFFISNPFVREDRVGYAVA